MNQRGFIDRLLSPAGFGLVLLFFVLPFVTMSCSASSPASPNGPKFGFEATFTGVDLLVGGSPDLTELVGDNVGGPTSEEDTQAEEAAFDDRYGKYFPPQPVALAAAAVIFAGMIIALLLPPARRAWPSVAAAVVGAVLLAIEIFAVAPTIADHAVADELGDLSSPDITQGLGGLEHGTTPAIGFWSVIVVLLGLAGWQAYVALHPAAPAGEADTGPPGTPPRPGLPADTPAPGAPPAGAVPLG
jgi:hypothetical protein